VAGIIKRYVQSNVLEIELTSYEIRICFADGTVVKTTSDFNYWNSEDVKSFNFDTAATYGVLRALVSESCTTIEISREKVTINFVTGNWMEFKNTVRSEQIIFLWSLAAAPQSENNIPGALVYDRYPDDYMLD
jgi:hypothetical protein